LIRRLISSLFLLLLVVVAGAFLWLHSSTTPLEGTIKLQGLSGPVTIERDAAGVPTITATTDNDAAFAMGFVHAEDRLFQMDLMRRAVAGRLSELFGPDALGTDKFMRTLGLYRAGAKQFDALSPQVQAGFKAYAEGVNAFLKSRRGALPPEYYLLNATPEPWTAADTLSWGKIMGLQLSGNFRGEILRARLAQKLTIEQIETLYPEYPKDAPTAIGKAASLLKDIDLGPLYAALPEVVGLHYASNNWVVDGTHSASGKPLLANDPHLGFSAPGVWYLARIVLPNLKIEGATAPGVPAIVIGHNEKIAWGFTTTGTDIEDLFVEKLDPANPGRYLTPEGSAAFETRPETIRIRGAAPLEITVRTTRHGPVVSDLGGNFGAGEGQVLAMQAVFLEDGDQTPDALWNMNRAKDWESFRGALRTFGGPQQNMVYADVDGNIGFIAPARLPIRAKGNGWMPVPGWTGEYDWTGYVPFEEMPSQYNPSAGRIVSANNKIVPEDYPHFITRDWDIPNRAIRINQMLDETPRQSPESSSAIQADSLSLMAKDLLPLMLRIAPPNERAKAAMDRLRAWDARMTGAAPEPLIFTAWLRDFNRVVLAEKLGPAFDDYWDLRPAVAKAMLTGQTQWCANSNCDQALATSLDRTLADLAKSYGDDMSAWRWDTPHRAIFNHPVLSHIPVLKSLFALEIPADGGYDTVNRGNTSIGSQIAPFADVHGPGMRMIVDMADPSAATFLVTPGQSGNPLSRHFGDLMQSWRDFRWLKLGGAARQKLVLEPQ